MKRARAGRPAIPFRVMGHPRSGNHLLASVLHRSLVPGLPGRTVVNSGTGHWSQRNSAAPYAGAEDHEGLIEMPYHAVLGTHVFPRGRPGVPIVYVFRDGRDVALSCYRWAKLRSPDQEDVPLATFLREPIDWRGSPGSPVPAREGYVLFDHWRDHLDAWMRTNAILVRYEELVTNPRETVEGIARGLDLDLVADPVLPGPVGWHPSQGAPRIGVWKTELSPDELELFEAKVPSGHRGRWEPR